MSNPGWYLEDPDDVIVLPVQARFESPLRTIRATGVYSETYRGETDGYTLISRRHLRPIFHVSKDQLDTWQTLYETVSNITAFYYVPDSGDIDTVVWVKLVEPDFDPQPIIPAAYGGVVIQRYSFTLEMIEQKPPVEILA